VAAPLLPLVSERIWKDLTGGRSVHLTDWPDASAFPREDELVAAMDSVRAISSTALSLRKQSGLRVRLPLSTLTVVTTDTAGLAPFESILREELNVKAVRLVEFEESSAERFGVTSRLTVNARAAGPRLGKNVQTVIKAARAGNWTETDGTVVAGGIALEEGEYELKLEASGTASGSALALLPAGGFLLLDTEVTPELEAEGLARDVIRAVQDARKAAGLEVSDRISLSLSASDQDAESAIREHGGLISAETLSEELRVLREDAVSGDSWKAVGQGSQVRIEVAKR
jgi:isoleucyl-tRNA synthetase